MLLSAFYAIQEQQYISIQLEYPVTVMVVHCANSQALRLWWPRFESV